MALVNLQVVAATQVGHSQFPWQGCITRMQRQHDP